MNNMIKKYLMAIVLLCVVSCEKNYTHNGCDAKTSHKVYEGWFSSDEIKSIGYIKSNGSDLYPMPSEKDILDSLKITDVKFIEKFASVMKSKNTKDDLDSNCVQALHIFIQFKNGKIACLYSHLRSRGAYLSPMYTFDAYGHTANELHNLFNSLP